MAEIIHKQDFALDIGEQSLLLSFSIFDPNSKHALLFIHADFLSSQWPLNEIGVEVLMFNKIVELKITHIKSQTHQTWRIKETDYQRLVDYFKILNFPLHSSGRYSKGS